MKSNCYFKVDSDIIFGNMSEKNQKRNLNIDLIKVLAVFLVVLVHFFNRTGYYGLPSGSPLMFFATFIWSVAMACVPLFLIATGYLMKNAKYFLQIYCEWLDITLRQLWF